MLAQTEGGIAIPMSCDDVTFSQFCDFQAAEQLFFGVNSSEDKEAEDYDDDILAPTVLATEQQVEENELTKQENAVYHMLEACQIFCKGDLSVMPLALEGDDINDLFAAKFMFGLDDDVSLTRLYCHLVTMIQSYKPKEVNSSLSVEWKGAEYHMGQKEAYNALTGIALTVGESLTLLEFQRKYNALIEGKRKKGEPDGNLAFSLGLKEVAILLRPKGQHLPIKKPEREAFIDRQCKVFQDLPLSIVLDVRFFLLATLISYAKQRILSTFSTHPKTKRSLQKSRVQKKLKELSTKLKILGVS